MLQCRDLPLDIDAAAADTVEPMTAVGRQPGVRKSVCVCVVQSAEAEVGHMARGVCAVQGVGPSCRHPGKALSPPDPRSLSQLSQHGVSTPAILSLKNLLGKSAAVCLRLRRGSNVNDFCVADGSCDQASAVPFGLFFVLLINKKIYF